MTTNADGCAYDYSRDWDPNGGKWRCGLARDHETHDVSMVLPHSGDHPYVAPPASMDAPEPRCAYWYYSPARVVPKRCDLPESAPVHGPDRRHHAFALPEDDAPEPAEAVGDWQVMAEARLEADDVCFHCDEADDCMWACRDCIATAIVKTRHDAAQAAEAEYPGTTAEKAALLAGYNAAKTEAERLRAEVDRLRERTHEIQAETARRFADWESDLSKREVEFDRDRRGGEAWIAMIENGDGITHHSWGCRIAVAALVKRIKELGGELPDARAALAQEAGSQ